MRYSDEAGELPVPGRPAVVPTPGPTLGHCALLLADRDVVVAGDAWSHSTLTRAAPDRGWSRAATVDSERNRASLDALEATGARIVLTGHGAPWTSGAGAAVAAARAAPIA